MAVKQARPTTKLIVLEAGTLAPALSLTSDLMKHGEEKLSARIPNTSLSLLPVAVQPFLLLLLFPKPYSYFL